MASPVELGDEAAIRLVIDRWAQAFHDKDVDAVVALHDPDTVSFDIVPPLRYVGMSEYRKPWDETFANFGGPIEMEIRDLVITVGGDVAFSYSLNRMIGVLNDGTELDYWMRWTVCYRRIDGRWLIVHDHSAAPTDFATGGAALDLQP
ncbi:Ketosteroid isomerase homolog [Nocardia amikacinitolerans]|uniref:YybH family protein n=1 Tax=Nocardia amikacinitolerans TaxID=756689 RepID=UPI00082BD204|nr:nuclear transport factor 2 family protein [Nocardia amikacinitolerans]MCP2315298.1 Ketosteroid isomerase homolog [Nocardia amikacinitolerans]